MRRQIGDGAILSALMGEGNPYAAVRRDQQPHDGAGGQFQGIVHPSPSSCSQAIQTFTERRGRGPDRSVGRLRQVNECERRIRNPHISQDTAAIYREAGIGTKPNPEFAVPVDHQSRGRCVLLRRSGRPVDALETGPVEPIQRITGKP